MATKKQIQQSMQAYENSKHFVPAEKREKGKKYKTIDEVAAVTNTNRNLFRRAVAVRRKGVWKLKELVEAGYIHVTAAEKLLDLSHKEQLHTLAHMGLYAEPLIEPEMIINGHKTSIIVTPPPEPPPEEPPPKLFGELVPPKPGDTKPRRRIKAGATNTLS